MIQTTLKPPLPHGLQRIAIIGALMMLAFTQPLMAKDAGQTAVSTANAAAQTANQASAKLTTEPLQIFTKSAIHNFMVEVARTPPELTQGLMHRKSLANAGGMLFDFGDDRQPRSMWMKNTLIPLDILFLANDGRIVKIAKGKPHSEAIIDSDNQPIRAVLELKGGVTKRLGIAVGDRVMNPLFMPPMPG
jgi:uncharacterized membrane protein (UPF0127 family)